MSDEQSGQATALGLQSSSTDLADQYNHVCVVVAFQSSSTDLAEQYNHVCVVITEFLFNDYMNIKRDNLNNSDIIIWPNFLPASMWRGHFKSNFDRIQSPSNRPLDRLQLRH